MTGLSLSLWVLQPLVADRFFGLGGMRVAYTISINFSICFTYLFLHVHVFFIHVHNFHTFVIFSYRFQLSINFKSSQTFSYLFHNCSDLYLYFPIFSYMFLHFPTCVRAFPACCPTFSYFFITVHTFSYLSLPDPTCFPTCSYKFS